jgi:hypothetical protein
VLYNPQAAQVALVGGVHREVSGRKVSLLASLASCLRGRADILRASAWKSGHNFRSGQIRDDQRLGKREMDDSV